MGIKDMLCTQGVQTTAGSKILGGFVPPYSATVVERLEKAGAISLGKTNLDEFAMGSSSETSHYGVSRNPWNLDCVPGGSSGGSAAAVAAGMCAASIGTDTGGSIRQPANFCGVVGVKPTYGRVSRFGIVAFASSLDQAGPMTRSVEDAALILEVICGKDAKDATTSTKPVPEFSKHLNKSLKGIKIGLPREYFSDKVSADTQAAVDRTIQAAKAEGAEVVEVSIPLSEYGVPVYYLIATSEASSNLARYDGVRFGYRADFQSDPAKDTEDFYSRTRGEGFGPEVKRRIVLGTYALSSGYYDAYYIKACQVRRLLREQFLAAFQKCDVMLSPVTTHPAFKVGERLQDPLQMYLNDIFTISTNLAGIPGMSLPAGFSREGLPIGVQLSAAHFQEQKMLNVAYALEQQLKISDKVPNVF
jgi:aspartyl-tRNA(Asn)/glutamyl-tRNA(Gln) amidotransferase subunit A